MAKDFFADLKKELLIEGTRHWKLIVFGAVIGLFAAAIFFGLFSGGKDPHAGHDPASSDSIKHWTCSMHPQIKLPQKGLCPICAMDLIPIHDADGEDGGGPASLTLSEAGRKLAEIETEVVTYQEVFHDVRLVGKVNYDETRLSYISAWVPGRIDRLFVDFTGIKVRTGDHLIELYSPELLATQEEYLQSIKNLESIKDSPLSVIRDTARTTIDSAREKLRLYGITDKQIKELVTRGSPVEHMTIYSPIAGTVIHKNGFEGMYVQTGDRIYTIVDLSKVWVYLDAYEGDIQWLHYGQRVDIEAESFPGEVFEGKIAFIDPFVDEKTRTIKLRVNVDNKGERLKPGMFVRTKIRAVLGEGGKIYEEELAGKWICPMHPDVLKDRQEPCDICEMELIKTSEFGFADSPTDQKMVLVIPRTAPLITGRRAVVYVENEAQKDTLKRYEGREVVLGPRAGDQYIVLSGLKEGDRVVTQGNFKIDSALQISGKPSMMNPAGYYSEEDNILTFGAGTVRENAGILSPSITHYLAAALSLAEDNPHAAAKDLEEFRGQIDQIIIDHSLEGKIDGLAGGINQVKEELSVIDHSLDSLRVQFGRVSNILKNIFEVAEYREELTLYLSFCPMAFDNKGGYWLQDSQDIRNPYFGASMLKCGEIKGEYGRKIQMAPAITGHEGH